MLVVISVLGIVAAIGVTAITGTIRAAQWSTASSNLEMLNAAVRKYSHAVKELTNAADSGISDETAIFAELKIDETNNLEETRPGSPYLEPHIRLNASSDISTYRAFWNGNEFKLIGLGTNGTGVDLTKLQ